MNDVIALLRNEFENDIEKNGLFWRFINVRIVQNQ